MTSEYVPAESKIDEALQFMMSVFKKKSMAFIFSDFEDSYDLKILRVASKKHQLLGMRVFDDKDNEIPDIGYALFHDAETGKQVWANTSNSRWRYNYAEHQKKKIKEVTEDFENSSASFMNINTGEDYSKFLYQYFRKR